MYVFFHDRSKIGIEYGCTHSRIFAEFGNQFMGGGYINLRIFFIDNLTDPDLMLRVDKGKQRAYGDGLRALFLQVTHCLTDTVFIQGGFNRAVIKNPFLHLALHAVRYQALRLLF